MLKINAIKLVVSTTNGTYGFATEFKAGLNIVRGDNSSGKSTIFQSILYGLGMEELIGSRNEKAMQSVLKDEVLNAEKIKEAEVIESSIFLEIENESTITVERAVKSQTKDPRLVTVYYGALLTGTSKQLGSDSMYVHDAGSATDVKFGYFAFLEKFLGFKLPEVQYNDGAVRKLYLQTIFPAFVIEQKVGWSDFLATIPYFNLRDKEKRAIEFLLKLDSWTIEERKQEVARLKQNVELKWSDVLIQINELARRSATKVNGISDRPSVLNGTEQFFLSYSTIDKEYSLADYILLLNDDLVELEINEIPKIQDISKEKESELSTITDEYNIIAVQYDDLANKKNAIAANIATIRERLKQIEEELIHNKHHLKVKKLASDKNLSLGNDICPTCRQSIRDSLLPLDSIQNPMNIEQNIQYLDAQKSMIKVYLENHSRELSGIQQKINHLEAESVSKRERIRAIKKDLISDERLPSVELIERRIKLKHRLDFYLDIEQEFEKLTFQLSGISNEWEEVLSEEIKLPKESFSNEDFAKLRHLNISFIELLKRFDYGSKSLTDLSISKDKLIPVAEGQYNIKYNMRLDSSASDLVRAIAAYTCALYRVSERHQTNHPGLVMFDEPGTQETAISTLREILKELQGYNAQSIVFASFKQSDSDFMETTNGLNFFLIQPPSKKFIVKGVMEIQSTNS